MAAGGAPGRHGPRVGQDVLLVGCVSLRWCFKGRALVLASPILIFLLVSPRVDSMCSRCLTLNRAVQVWGRGRAERQSLILGDGQSQPGYLHTVRQEIPN